MRKSVFVIAVLAFSLAACSPTPPKPIADNFNSKFSGATKVKWDQEEENEWEAEFYLDGNEMSASFDNAGNWLETEKEIKANELPSTVAEVVNSKYSDYKVEEMAELIKSDFLGYEISLKKGDTEIEIQVLSNGTINNIKRIVDDEEDED